MGQRALSRPWPPTPRRSKSTPREWVPLDWAATQNNLGNALAVLGERESGTARLEQAVTAFTEALQGAHPRASAPLLGCNAETISALQLRP